jgi:sphingomyelin phosphodiesterase acid-like 3
MSQPLFESDKLLSEGMRGDSLASLKDSGVVEQRRTSACSRNAIIIYTVLGCFLAAGIGVAIYLLVTKSPDPSLPDSEFLYINDIHLDPFYEPYARFDDPNTTYCRARLPEVTTPYPFGQYGCDCPNTTFYSMLAQLPKVSKNPKFIIFGGDALGHETGYDRSQVQSNFRLILNEFSKLYPNIPVLVSLGNNEFVPNYGTIESDPLDFQSLGDVLRPYLNDDQLQTFLKGGYYFQDFPADRLRILLLNTVVYDAWRPVEDDPNGQLAWIESVSAAAKALNFEIGVALHIPPQVITWRYSQGWNPAYVDRFFNLAAKYAFSFTLAAHSHFDSLLPMRDPAGNPFAFALSSPSVSPAHANNPGFRVITFQKGRITDIMQYYAEIMMNPQDSLDWQLEYQFSAAYGVPDLSTGNLGRVVRWIRETGEGMWRYMERTAARAEGHAKFFYCVLNAVSKEDIDKCTGALQFGRGQLAAGSERE